MGSYQGFTGSVGVTRILVVGSEQMSSEGSAHGLHSVRIIVIKIRMLHSGLKRGFMGK